MFHNDAKVLARLERIEASQVSTESIVAEIRSVFKGLEVVLCETMASCTSALKSASNDNRHGLGCCQGLKYAKCCTGSKESPRQGSRGRKMSRRAMATKNQKESTHQNCFAEPGGIVQDCGNCPEKLKNDISPVVACPNRCDEINFCESGKLGSQTARKGHIEHVELVHEKGASNSAWEVISTIQTVGTLYEINGCNANKVQEEETHDFKLYASANLRCDSEHTEEINCSSNRTQFELAKTTICMLSTDYECGTTAYQADCSRILFSQRQGQKVSGNNFPSSLTCPQESTLTTDTVAQDQHHIFLQPSTNLLSTNADSDQATNVWYRPRELRKDDAYSFLEHSPPSTPLSGSTQSWSPSINRTQIPP